eukprot:393673-Pleurochrysis_carterae.AAC.3
MRASVVESQKCRIHRRVHTCTLLHIMGTSSKWRSLSTQVAAPNVLAAGLRHGGRTDTRGAS